MGMKTATKRILILFLLFLNLASLDSLIAQESAEEKYTGFGSRLLNAFWDRDLSRWSLRAIANHKVNDFWIRNEDYRVEFTPNNPSGIGFGIANSKLIVDIIFNLKTNKDAVTERLDIQGDFIFGRSYILFQFQEYQGFNAKNVSIEDPGVFRRDIKTRTFNLSYFYIFNTSVNVLHRIFSGAAKDYGSAGTVLGGVYTAIHRLDADSSIIPPSSEDLFNEEAQIIEMDQFGFGINLGYSYLFALPSDFLIYLSGAPGIGLSFKDIRTETINYRPSNIWQFTLNADIQIGYNGRRIYALVSSINTWFFSSLNYGNTTSSNSLKFKLVLGVKLGKQE